MGSRRGKPRLLDHRGEALLADVSRRDARAGADQLALELGEVAQHRIKRPWGVVLAADAVMIATAITRPAQQCRHAA
jgi:hypothetical protein